MTIGKVLVNTGDVTYVKTVWKMYVIITTCLQHFDICIRTVIPVYLLLQFGRIALFYHSYSIILPTIQSGIYRAISLILSFNTAVVVGSFTFEAFVCCEFIYHFLLAFQLALYHRSLEMFSCICGSWLFLLSHLLKFPEIWRNWGFEWWCFELKK